jgi:alpha-beta hydrolase superfamily lysophospholipase
MDDARDPSEARPTPFPGHRLLWRCLRALVVIVVLWLLVSWVVAYRLTHRRHPRFVESLPAAAATAYESTRLTTRDGQNLGAWYVAGRDEAPTVLLLHGNGGSRWNCLGRAEMFRSAGYPVLMISLRAHGDSSGDYNDVGYGARLDVVAAVEFLERRRPGRPVVILGTSLGAAAALFASQELGHRVDGYILESPYRDLRTAVWNRVNNELPPGVDWVAYRGLLLVAPLVVPHLDRISPWKAAGDVPSDVPMLILAGEDDRHARLHEARAIFDRVRSHAELVVIPGVTHLRMIELDPPRYNRLVLDFLAAVEAHAGPSARAPRGVPLQGP